MYYKSPTDSLYWYDSGAPLDGLPDGSTQLTHDEARALIGCELHGPSPYPSWVLHESEAHWIPPVARPAGDAMWSWDETIQSWIEITGA
jgi:hypothetical protein